MKLSWMFFALGVPVLAGSLVPRDEVTLVAREGLVLTKTFTRVSESETDSISERGTNTSSSNAELTLVVTDRITKADEDRVLELERTYDEITGETESEFSFNGNSREQSSEARSDLEGEAVVFTWDEDDEEYYASSDDVDEELLAELVYDYDFSRVLPEQEVAEGDEWEIDAEDFDSMLNPWEGLALDWGGPEIDAASERAEPDIENSHSGEIIATFTGTRDEDGVLVAVITLEGELETEMTMEVSNDDGQSSSESEQEMVTVRSVVGELLWNTEGGHLHSLEIEVEIDASGRSHNLFRFGDQEFENDSEIEQTGTRTFTASFAPVEDEE